MAPSRPPSIPSKLNPSILNIGPLQEYDAGFGDDLFAIVDQAMRKAFAVTKNYGVEIQNLVLPNGLTLSQIALARLILNSLQMFEVNGGDDLFCIVDKEFRKAFAITKDYGVETAGVVISQKDYPGWSVLFLDKNDRLLWGIKEDGTVVSGAPNSSSSAISASATVLATAESVNGISQIFSTYKGVQYQLTSSTANNTNPQALSDKVLYQRNSTFYYKAANNAGREILAVSASPIAVWGDSYGAMLFQTPPVGKNLSSLLKGRSTLSFATGGQTGAQIAARQGGKYAIATISGGIIPASGSVGVSMNVDLLNPPGGGAGGPILGTLGGAYGSLSKDASNVYTFTRTVNGSAINITSAPFIPDTFNYSLNIDNAELTTIFLGFRNGVGDNAETDVSLTTLMLSKLLPLYPRPVILSQFTAQSGTAIAADVTRRASNDSLKAAFPDYYFDVRTQTILTAKTYLNTNYPGVWTAQSDTDVANDDVPSCLFNGGDAVHINSYGAEIYSYLVANYIISKNW